MVVLISHPESFPDEINLVVQLLDELPELIFHLRKPKWNRIDLEIYLDEIPAAYHERIVVHSDEKLDVKFQLKGIHCTGQVRQTTGHISNFISTSFHSLKDVKLEGESFDYFFCSPVFQSISKKLHLPSEEWNLNRLSLDLSRKAVALGGIELNKLETVKSRGFQHIALLGAVWESSNPLASCREIYQTWYKLDLIA
jgi:thiamine-phosphate pyrophosphorylase